LSEDFFASFLPDPRHTTIPEQLRRSTAASMNAIYSARNFAKLLLETPHQHSVAPFSHTPTAFFVLTGTRLPLQTIVVPILASESMSGCAEAQGAPHVLNHDIPSQCDRDAGCCTDDY
jgi:hypothetical protein